MLMFINIYFITEIVIWNLFLMILNEHLFKNQTIFHLNAFFLPFCLTEVQKTQSADE